MKSLLQRLKLIEYQTTEIPMSQIDFVEKLKMNVDPGDTGSFLSAFEAFGSSKNEYKGLVTSESFKIRRRRKFFETTLSLAVAEGTFRQSEKSLLIETTIKGFRGIYVPFFVFIMIFYIVFIVSAIFSDTFNNMDWVFVPFIFIHASMMLGIPYFIMRRGVSRMKYELERDFYYLTRNQLQNV